MVSIVWFRQDLRLADNPALQSGIERGAIIPIYCLDDGHAGEWAMGAASRWWLHHSLRALNQSLAGRLQLLVGDPLQLLPQLMALWCADTICWNRCYEPWRMNRDRQLKQSLMDGGHTVISHNGSLLWEPWQVLKKDGTPYRVFTPYYRKGCLKTGDPRFPCARPDTILFADAEQRGVALEQLQLLPSIHRDVAFSLHWQPGESGAMNHLQGFLVDTIDRYRQGRDFPAQAATSRLSAHLHFGELSPNQIWYAATGSDYRQQRDQDRSHDRGQRAMEQCECFLRELGWREFSYYLLYHFPDLPRENFQDKFKHFPWRHDRELIATWQQGLTGVPIVDAGMRELWQTGTMHNRLRMIVASFLVKNLRQHWHHGQRWFWDCLLDADLANNSASWQWVAGSGADAAPYFRIFNPVIQGQRFDAEGEYVRRFCPELAGLPTKYMHQPWAAPQSVLDDAGIELGVDYPQPLVDLKLSRQQALESFALMKARAG